MIYIVDYSNVPARELPKHDPPKEEYIERIMAGLKCDRAEAEEVYAYDKALDPGERTEFDLPPEKEEFARTMSHTGTRERKSPMVPNLTKRERKPNATKGGIVEELVATLRDNSGFDIKYLQVPNKEGKVSFMIGGKWYTWTLTEHRKKPAHVQETEGVNKD